MDAINRPLAPNPWMGETSYKSRYGTMSGRILFTENDGNSCERTANPCWRSQNTVGFQIVKVPIRNYRRAHDESI